MKQASQYFLHYYKPKAFEYYRGKTIYDLLGIRWYKKYLPTTGDIARRRKNIKQLDLTKEGRYEALYRYELKTRNYEWRHILGLILFILLAFLIGKPFSLFDWVFAFVLNLMINVYPIFLQRHNRIRILSVLERNGKANPYLIS